jgi:hypothetical protein
MKKARSLIVVCIAALLFACSSGATPGEPTIGHAPSGGSGYTGPSLSSGAVTIDGIFLPGVTITTMQYSITGPSGSYNGSWSTAGTMAGTQVSGINSGTYSVTITATETAGSGGFFCTGTTSGVIVTAENTTACSVNVVCGAEAGINSSLDAGSLAIETVVSSDGGVVYCAAYVGLGVTSNNLPANGATAIVPVEVNNGSGSVPSVGTLDSASAAGGALVNWSGGQFNFTCNAWVGPVTFSTTLLAADQPLGCGAAANQTATAMLVCE